MIRPVVRVADAETRSQIRGVLGEIDECDPLEPAVDDPAIDTAQVDMWIVDTQSIGTHREAIEAAKRRADPVVHPCVVVCPRDTPIEAVPGVAVGGGSEFGVVDDVLRVPLATPELRIRLENVLARTRLSRGLAKRETERDLFRAAIDHAGHSVYITESDGEIVYVNEAFERVTGYQAEEAIGSTPRILKSGHHGGAFYEELWETILDGRVWENDVLNARKNGELYYVDQTIAPIIDDSGQLTHFVAINTDVTEREVQDQQTQVLSRVLRHNLRNKLNLVQGHVRLLGEGGTVDATVADIAEIERAIDELLRLSRKVDRSEDVFDRGQLRQPREISAVVERVCTTMQQQYPDAEITWQTPTVATIVEAKVELALEELIENAIEHNDRPEPTVELTAARRNGGSLQLLIEIEDDGPGIPNEERRVFEHGEETPLFHSSGLGLWLVYWIVTLAGGDISMADRTDNDRGTDIRLNLPYRETTIPPGAETEPTEPKTDGVQNPTTDR
ncbi:MAG: PAS domain S-box protein [Halobacteriota archaeon]